jgi:hypothetical protein
MAKKLSALFALLFALSIFASCTNIRVPSESELGSATEAVSSTPESSEEPSAAPSSAPAPSQAPIVVAPQPSQAPATSRVSPAEELSKKKRKKEASDWRYGSKRFYEEFLYSAALSAGYTRGEIIEGVSATADLVNRNPAGANNTVNAEFYIANFYAPSGWCLSVYYGIDTSGYSYVAVVYYRPNGNLGGLGSYATLTDAQVAKYLSVTLPIFESDNCPSFTLLREMKTLA